MSSVLNPANPRAVDLYGIPPAESGSRFARRTSPEGYAVSSPTEAAFLAYDRLLADRRDQAEPVPPLSKTVRLRFVGRNTAGEWTVVPRGAVTGVPIFAGTPPTKFAKLKLSGPGDCLDSFFLGEEAWSRARDEEIWRALLDWLTEEQPPANVVRQINDRVALAICLRGGLDLHQSELPNPGTPYPDQREENN